MPVRGGPPEPFRVRLVEGKFLHCQRQTLETYHIMFPDDTSFRTLHVVMERGLEELAPVIDVTREHAERVRSLETAYRDGRLPIALFARMAGLQPCDVWDASRERADLPLLCSVGSAAERDEATAALVKSVVQVLDYVAVYAAAGLGVGPQVEAAFPGPAVTRSAVDHLRALVEERWEALAAGGGTMEWDGRSLVLDKPSKARRASSLATAEWALVSGCRIVAAEGPAPGSRGRGDPRGAAGRVH